MRKGKIPADMNPEEHYAEAANFLYEAKKAVDTSYERATAFASIAQAHGILAQGYADIRPTYAEREKK